MKVNERNEAFRLKKRTFRKHNNESNQDRLLFTHIITIESFTQPLH